MKTRSIKSRIIASILTATLMLSAVPMLSVSANAYDVNKNQIIATAEQNNLTLSNKEIAEAAKKGVNEASRAIGSLVKDHLVATKQSAFTKWKFAALISGITTIISDAITPEEAPLKYEDVLKELNNLEKQMNESHKEVMRKIESLETSIQGLKLENFKTRLSVLCKYNKSALSAIKATVRCKVEESPKDYKSREEYLEALRESANETANRTIFNMNYEVALNQFAKDINGNNQEFGGKSVIDFYKEFADKKFGKDTEQAMDSIYLFHNLCMNIYSEAISLMTASCTVTIESELNCDGSKKLAEQLITKLGEYVGEKYTISSDGSFVSSPSHNDYFYATNAFKRTSSYFPVGVSVEEAGGSGVPFRFYPSLAKAIEATKDLNDSKYTINIVLLSDIGSKEKRAEEKYSIEKKANFNIDLNGNSIYFKNSDTFLNVSESTVKLYDNSKLGSSVINGENNCDTFVNAHNGSNIEVNGISVSANHKIDNTSKYIETNQ